MGRRAGQIDERTLQLLERIEEEDDPRIAWGVVHRRIKALREEGREVPEVLVKAERQLMTDLTSESQGR